MKILGCNYKLEQRFSVKSLDSFGKFIGQTQEIQIANDLPKEHFESTILYEIIEAINWHLGLKLEHPTIMGLETGLYQVLTENGVDLSPLAKPLRRH